MHTKVLLCFKIMKKSFKDTYFIDPRVKPEDEERENRYLMDLRVKFDDEQRINRHCMDLRVKLDDQQRINRHCMDFRVKLDDQQSWLNVYTNFGKMKDDDSVVTSKIQSGNKGMTEVSKIELENKNMTEVPKIQSANKGMTEFSKIQSENKNMTEVLKIQSKNKNMTEVLKMQSANEGMTKSGAISHPLLITRLDRVISSFKKISILNIILALSVHTAYTGYADQYLVALEDLIKVHKKYFPHEPIAMNDTSLVYSVYQKIIAPWALDINGRAHIVENKFYSKKSYLNDLEILNKNFMQYQSYVTNLKNYFSGVDTSDLLQAFYQSIGDDVVQIFLNIIQDSVNALTLDPQDLEACFIAYQIANAMYGSGMHITGIQEGADFQSTISGNMVTLYQHAINNLSNKLSIGMLATTDIETIYDQIARYYMYLASVGTRVHDTQLISTSQAQATQACQNYGYYLQAQKLYQQAQTLIKKYPHSATLDLRAIKQVALKLAAIGQNIRQISQLTQEAHQYYTQAQDIFGANQAELLQTLVDDIDLWIVQGVAQLWLLYLQDQTDQNQYTAQTIAAYLSPKNQTASNPVTNQNLIAALQNLYFFMNHDVNPINALSTIDVLKSYSLKHIVASLKEEIIKVVQSGVTSVTDSSAYNFASLEAIVAVENSIFYLSYVVENVIDALSQSDPKKAMTALAYAQALDELYATLSADIREQVDTLIAYLPYQLNKNRAIWFDWVAKIVLSSGVANKKDVQRSKVAKITIQKPTSVRKTPQKQDVLNLVTLAHQNALEGNFLESSEKYQQAMKMYTALYEINPSDASIYTQMMYTRTLYTALSFAGTIQPQGNQEWNGIKGIPTEYVATNYEFNGISVADLGMSELPASLLTIPASVAYTNCTPEQQKDILQIIQAHVISQLLSVQGVSFNQIFVDYQLNFKTGVDQAGKDLARQIQTQVALVFHQFVGTTIAAVTLADATSFASIVCKNLFLSDITPLFSSMATALTFYASAQVLMAPSTNQVKLGDASYSSGNDQQLSEIFLEKMVKVYLAAAYPHYQEAKNMVRRLRQALKNNKNNKFPVDFLHDLKIIGGHIVRAQALLYAQDQSAYVYAKSVDQNMADSIEALFFDMYQNYVVWMKQSLVGKNPFDPVYQELLHKINTVYVAWASLLRAQNKTLQAQAIDNEIVALFTTAGQGCMNISYQEPLYPHFTQYHYATAAHYFIAVQMQYTKMKQVTEAAAINELINDAYFKGSSQNSNLFLHVQKYGVTITTQETKKKKNIAFSDLIAQQIFASTAEQDAYDSVQNLLLNAGIGYSFLKKRVQKKSSTASNSKQTIVSQSQSPLSPAVTSYLQAHNIISSTEVIPSYLDAGVAQAIFAINMDAYAQFKNNPDDYASWLDVVYSALQALYSINYLGAKPQETGQEMEHYMTEFFTQLEKHTSSLENPSSVYVG